MKYLILILIMVAALASSFAQDESVVVSYSISAEFFPDDAQMYNYTVAPDAFMRAKAEVEISEPNVDSLIFYLHGELKIDSVISGSKKLDCSVEKVLYYFNYNMLALKVTVNTSGGLSDGKLVICYSGFMNPSRARGLSDYMCINKNTGVFLRSYGYSLWFPVFIKSEQGSYSADFKSVTVRLPKEFKSVVCGVLVKEFTEGNTYTSVWSPGVMDIKDIQCAAQNYKIMSGNNVFVYYLSDEKSSEKILDYSIKLKKLYSENLKYIDESLPLYILEMPKYGDISSENVVGISEKNFRAFDDGLDSKLTIAHELVHPYLRIPVSVDNDFYSFVVEGFPSFFQAYALKKMEGDKYDIHKVMLQVEKSYMDKKTTGKTRRGNILPVEKAILDIKFDEIGSYKDTFVLVDRVWLFFYDIWNKMGDVKFDGFLKELFTFGSIDYEKFEKLVLSYLPDYKMKLNIWLNSTEYPQELRIVQ